MVNTTDAQKKEVIREIRQGHIMGNEKIWTYFIANILDKSKYKVDYLRLFCGDEITFGQQMDIWYESEPIPPKKYEGNTKLDLALGSIRKRGNTELGIEYDIASEHSWVCFVEAKYYSDCSTTVSYDTIRNQIVRVIENLLCFQAEGKYPGKLIFTLLTPRIYKINPRARLYGYKMKEYEDHQMILKDIRQSSIKDRDSNNWKYPNLEERLKLLRLNWVCYEDILEKEFNLACLDITVSNWRENEQLKYIVQQIMNMANDISLGNQN